MQTLGEGEEPRASSVQQGRRPTSVWKSRDTPISFSRLNGFTDEVDRSLPLGIREAGLSQLLSVTGPFPQIENLPYLFGESPRNSARGRMYGIAKFVGSPARQTRAVESWHRADARQGRIVKTDLKIIIGKKTWSCHGVKSQFLKRLIEHENEIISSLSDRASSSKFLPGAKDLCANTTR
jgi:hypothetical protein